MKALVTGGAGFIGSHIVDRLIELNYEVVVIDNESSNSNTNFYWNTKAKNYKYDICDYKNTRLLYDGVDYVFHVAAKARIQATILDPIETIKTNSLGTATVLQCSKESNVKRVVYSSTSSAYGLNPIPNVETQPEDCLNFYSISKTNGEKLCNNYNKIFNLKTISLRYFNVYGDRQPTKGQYATLIGLFNKQKENKEQLTIVGDGKQRRDFTHVSDVVNANILAATKDIDNKYFGEVFNIGSGINYSVNQIANLFSNNTISIPERVGEARETLANNKKAKNILDWTPKVDLIEWINDFYAFRLHM
jgi:UDP-glucose 4-epimerase